MSDYFEMTDALDQLLEERGLYLSHAHKKTYYQCYARGHIRPHFPVPALPLHVHIGWWNVIVYNPETMDDGLEFIREDCDS